MSAETSVPAESQAPATSPAAGSCHRFENVEFDELKGELRVSGQPVAMEPRPLRVLSELLLRVNEVVTKEEFFEIVWEDRDTVDHVLANAISKLRGAMGEAGGRRIVTVPRVGYRLNGPVQRVDTVAPRTTFAAGQTVPGRDGFVLVRALGEASRSEVWLARHNKLGHEKVFKFASDGPGLSALKREYTLYRVLSHELGPRKDMAVVLDSNFVHAPYWIECEYGGQSLLEWAAADASLAALSRAERIALFLQIAGAVAAAHSVMVLHKDLKPANVLVSQPQRDASLAPSGALQIKLTDFGSGRVLGPDVLQRLNFTALGMTLGPGQEADRGTFGYMAPELATHAASTVQCDVYSLGVMLYQLVVADLQRPMASGWDREVEDPLLVQDILAATDGNPERRLASVAELVLRLQALPTRRQQQLEQTEARRLQAQQDAAQQRRRARRPWVVLATALAAVGLAASLWYAHEARLALAKALQQTQRAQAFDDFLTQDVLAADAVFYREGVVPRGMVSSLRVAASRLGQRFAGDELTQVALLLRVAKTLRMMGATDEAARQAQAAYTLAKQQPGRPAEQLQAAAELALCKLHTNQDVRATALLAEALDELGGSAVLQADKAEAIPLLEAQAREQLELGRFTESSRLARRWVQLADQHTPKDVANRLEARAFLLGVTLAAGEDAKTQALTHQMEAEVAALGGSIRAMTLIAERSVAVGLAGQRQFAAAMAMLEAGITRARQASPSMDLQLASHLSTLGNLQQHRGLLESALKSYIAATDLFQRSLGDDHQFYRVSAVHVAQVQAMLGQYPLAAQHLQAHRAWFLHVMAERGVYGRLHEWLAISLAGSRQPEAALAVLDEMADETKKPAAPSQTGTEGPSAERMVARGWAWLQLGKTADGLALMRQGLDIAAKQSSPHSWSLLEAAWAAEAARHSAGRPRPRP